MSHREEEQTNSSDNGMGDVRSLSAGDTPNPLMNPLNFENIDLLNTPLSSLRSCSEYTRYSLHNRYSAPPRVDPEEEDGTSASYYGYFLSFFYTPSKPKNRVRFRESGEDQVFLIERMRFNEANLIEGEDYNYRSDSTPNRQRISSSSSVFGMFFGSGGDGDGAGAGAGASPTRGMGADERRSSKDSRRSISNDSTCCTKKKPKRRARHRQGSGVSLMDESLHTLEFIFGFGSRTKDLPMEIELREFSPPQIITFYPEDSRGNIGLDTFHVPPGEARSLRRVTSLGMIERVRSDSLDSSSYLSSSRPSSPRPVAPARLDVWRRETWRPYLEQQAFEWQAYVRFNYAFQFRSDDLFYENLRIQPFSSGTYMRAMLVSGFCATLFNVYNVVSWPKVHGTVATTPTMIHVVVENILFTTLIMQTLVNLLQLPLRLYVHFQCWDTSRVIEVDRAISIIRSMLVSDSWLMNRMLGFCLDVSSIAILVLTESYLWLSTSNDLLRPLVISLGATNLMTIVMRVVVATVFALSMHDPQVLSEARRRGLSKWDLAVLPTFVFSSNEDVNNMECSICLGTFERGEMLTSLPCDKKHSFHSACIRQWLERQNSCPLCQKMV